VPNGLCETSSVDLTARLDTYVVTSVPRRRPRLRLVWSAVPAGESVVEDDSPLALAILDDYRITRVPVAS
jgi:hypothetical protein